jgi:carboxymethylenebutenolidase
LTASILLRAVNQSESRSIWCYSLANRFEVIMRTNRVGSIAVLMAGITVSIAVATPFAQQAPRGQGPGGRGGGGGGLGNKAPNLVASVWTASSTVARTKLRHEWVDVPLGNTRLRTWVEYPEGDGRAPVVVVLQHEVGLDDWMRSVADQLALEGFIAVTPDLFSGFGPNGGGFDSFPGPDVAMRQAGPRLTQDEAMRRALAAADFGLKLPRANGRIASLGVGSGGALSFRFAAEAPTVHAAVVFYGAAPDENVLRRIKAPVIGFYGEDDAVTGTVALTAAAMTRLGKMFAVHRYEGATQAFLAIQVEGLNGPATADAWPRATAFLKEHLLNAGGRQ